MARWIAVGGAFLVSLDSVVNIAFPAIAAGFGAPPEAMRWVIVCYVLVYAIVSFLGGALGDVAGHARVFAVGVALSAVGFLLCGAAPTFAVLLLGRAVQGVGAGLVYGTSPGIMTLATPASARGWAVGILNAALGLALTVGPPLAGVVVDSIGWRFVFSLRAPLALVLLGWALASLPAVSAALDRRLVSAGDIARARVLGPSVLSFVANAGIFSIWLLAPFYLAGPRGLSASASGPLFMLAPLAMTLAAPLAGWLADRVGGRALVAAGLLLEAAGLALLARAGPTTPVAGLAVALFVAGFGLGLFQVPNMARVMAAFGAGLQGAAGGLAFLARTLGIVGGVLTFAQVFALRRVSAGAETAFAEAFGLAAAGVGGAGLVALAAVLRRRP